MNRYPDKIIILEAVGGDPYNAPTWRQVYTGRCRCFLHRESGFRTNKVMDSTHQVVIPDRSMPEIGENFKVGIKMHTNESNRNWDLVGYVKDFARYDRVCNLNFQMVKENIIYEDIPDNRIDLSKRTNMVYDDEWLHLESVGLVDNSYLVEGEVLYARLNKLNKEGLFVTLDVLAENPNDGEIEPFMPESNPLCNVYTTFHDAIQQYIHLLVAHYKKKDDDEEWKPSLLIRLSHASDEPEGEPVVFYEKQLWVLPHKDAEQPEETPEPDDPEETEETEG